MAKIRRKRVLAAKIETTPGTAESLSGTDATINVFDPVIVPNIDNEERQGQGAFGKIASVPGVRSGTLTFMTELFGDGAGGIPAWASRFLPACGWVATSQVYTPRTEGPGSNVKTLTFGLYIDGLMYGLAGAQGSFRIVLTAGLIAKIEWTFQGIYIGPTDVAILTPTYLTFAPFRFVAETLTIGAWTPVLNNVTIESGNSVVLREDASKVSGIASAFIENRTPTVTMDPESVTIATIDHTALWLAGTLAALTIEIDNGVDRVTIAAPKFQRLNAPEGERTGKQIESLEGQCCKSADVGDDELSFTFAATD